MAAEARSTLRDLARGIYPLHLAAQGLPAALRAQAERLPLAVTVEAEGVGRYSQEVEAAAYFACLEALQNAVKHAPAATVTVHLSERQGVLVFSVADDGPGFDPSSTTGRGLQNMADRLSAVGGSLEIDSAPGKGTRLAGRLPLPIAEVTA